ncbi:MAG: CBS domain-containing protein [Myxococcota bacterium]
MLVRELMTEHPICVEGSASLGEAVDLFMEVPFRHLPVTEEGALVGMLSDRDVRSLIAPRVVDQEALASLKARYEQRVSQIMAPDPVTTHPEEDLSTAISMMLEHRVGALPVVDSASGDLLGILSYVDILRAAQEFLEQA